MKIDNVGVRDKVIAVKHQNPTWGCAAIGREVCVTRERARQILKEEGLSTKRIFIKKQHICPNCQKVINSKLLFCTKECRKQAQYTTLKCVGCGKEFKRLKREVTRRKKRAILMNKKFRVYCNKACFLNNCEFVGK